MLNQDQIRNIVCDIGKEYQTGPIYLFGSFAKGLETNNSDIDLLMEKGKIRGLIQLAGVHAAFEKRLGLPVDLLTPDCLDESFLTQIKPEEILLYAGTK